MEAKDKMNQMKDDELNKIHSDALGLTIPENYFSKSKNEILDKIATQNETKVIPFYKKRTSWLAAASVTLLLGLSILKTYNSQNPDRIASPLTDSIVQMDIKNPTTNNPIPNYNLTHENDILISSLFVDDKEIDEYITNSILDDI
ncbi:hypothetical protein ACYE2N_09660 [Flavobacterium sp. MAHUQ-51]|uniref:hypothetical protein n=1 Tax=Flavobacterium sp. GCM10022190 TaxID=3252639 RepID=UPI00360AE50A